MSVYLINSTNLSFCCLSTQQLITVIKNKQIIGIQNVDKPFSIYKFWIFETYVGSPRKKSNNKRKNKRIKKGKTKAKKTKNVKERKEDE